MAHGGVSEFGVRLSNGKPFVRVFGKTGEIKVDQTFESFAFADHPHGFVSDVAVLHD